LIVVDASIALGWFLGPNEEALPALRYVEEFGGAVPGNFHSEFVNGLLSAERQKRIRADESDAALIAVLDLSLEITNADPAHVMRVGRKQHLTAYDATYLTLAIERGLPLATADAALRRAAEQMGLLWGPP
jgi:predicted nucleic acid-binding protein